MFNLRRNKADRHAEKNIEGNAKSMRGLRKACEGKATFSDSIMLIGTGIAIFTMVVAGASLLGYDVTKDYDPECMCRYDCDCRLNKELYDCDCAEKVYGERYKHAIKCHCEKKVESKLLDEYGNKIDTSIAYEIMTNEELQARIFMETNTSKMILDENAFGSAFTNSAHDQAMKALIEEVAAELEAENSLGAFNKKPL